MRSSGKEVKRLRPLLGTFVAISLRGRAPMAQLNRWITAGFQAIEEVDRLMSFHRADSDLSRLNRAKVNEWVRLDPLTVKVLALSNTLYEFTSGLYDIRTNGYDARRQSPLELSGTRVRKKTACLLDLGGIAKGFAVDQAVEAIQTAASSCRTSGIVNAGGDLRVWGPDSFQGGTQVVSRTGSWFRLFPVSDCAVATSSVRSDSMDRWTPAVHRLMPFGTSLTREQTVTVFAERCVWADALTKVVLMGGNNLIQKCLSRFDARAIKFRSNGRIGAFWNS